MLVGSQLVLRCQTSIAATDDPTEWYFKKNNELSDVPLCKRGTMVNGNGDRMKIITNSSSGRYDLMIFNVSLEDAGTYTCLDDESSHVAVIVTFERYPSDAFCSLTPTDFILGKNQWGLAPDMILMSCDLRYRGYLTASLEWFNGDQVIPSNISERNGIITSTIQLSAVSLQNSNSKFTCRVLYGNKMESRFNWTKTVSVISSSSITKRIVDDCKLTRIDCPSFATNFTCSCELKDDNNNTVANDTYGQLSDMPPGNYTTIATCSFRGENNTFVAEQIEIGCKRDESSRFTIIIKAVVVLTVIIVVLVIFKPLRQYIANRGQSRYAFWKCCRKDPVTDLSSMEPLSELKGKNGHYEKEKNGHYEKEKNGEV